jgi:hypothetical protein
MLRTFLCTLGFVLVASTGAAQTISTPPVAGHSGDSVVLKDGTTLHGTVREMTPGKSLTITLSDGTARTLEWSEIGNVDIDRAKSVAQPQPVATTTMVHVEGVPSDAQLQELEANGTENAWTAVCTGPCDRALPSDGLYRIDAPGVRRSAPFRVEGASTKLEVSTASSLGHTGGLVMLIVGGVVLVNGLSFFLVASIDKDVITQDTYNTFMIVGGVLTGIGAVSATLGAILLGNNTRTKVTSGATTVRVPAWRDAPAPPTSRFAAMTFPLLGGEF